MKKRSFYSLSHLPRERSLAGAFQSNHGAGTRADSPWQELLIPALFIGTGGLSAEKNISMTPSLPHALLGHPVLSSGGQRPSLGLSVAGLCRVPAVSPAHRTSRPRRAERHGGGGSAGEAPSGPARGCPAQHSTPGPPGELQLPLPTRDMKGSEQSVTVPAPGAASGVWHCPALHRDGGEGWAPQKAPLIVRHQLLKALALSAGSSTFCAQGTGKLTAKAEPS